MPPALTRFDAQIGYETPVRKSHASTRRVIGGVISAALAIGVGGPLLSATPAYADDVRTYSKNTTNAAHELSVSKLPNGARADFEGVDCDALDALVTREATVRGLDKEVSCADGVGTVTLFGDVDAATRALAQTAADAFDQPSQALTAAEVANEQAAVDAIKPRLLISMPNNSLTTRSTFCTPARGNGVICATNIDQHMRTGQEFVAPKAGLVYLIEFVPVLKRTGGFDVGVRLSVISASNEIVTPDFDPPFYPPGFYTTEVCLQNGGDNPCVDNLTTGPKTDVRLAQNDWTIALMDGHLHKRNGRDYLTFDNLEVYIRDVFVCDDVGNWATSCYDTFTAITREQAVETYLSRTTGMGTDFGMALAKDTNVYDGTGKLVNSPWDLLVSDPRWTFQYPSREIRIDSHSPDTILGGGWSPDGTNSTLMKSQEVTITSTLVLYPQLFANWSPTHLEP